MGENTRERKENWRPQYQGKSIEPQIHWEPEKGAKAKAVKAGTGNWERKVERCAKVISSPEMSLDTRASLKEQ